MRQRSNFACKMLSAIERVLSEKGNKKNIQFSVKRRGDSEADHALRDGGTPEGNLGSPMESGAKRARVKILRRASAGASAPGSGARSPRSSVW